MFLPCSKNAERDELIDAVREIASGKTYFPPAIRNILARACKRPGLSSREMEVLRQLVRGQRNKKIAEELGLADLTIKQHVSSILSKLDARDRTHAAILAVERGLVRKT